MEASGTEPMVSWISGDERREVMDRLHEFLDAVRDQGVATGHFRGLLHLLIGQPIRMADGTLVSSGMTWRALAALLKKERWDREAVRELGIDPAELAPRDREKFWYTAIARAGVSSAESQASAQVVTHKLAPLGYVVGGPAGEAESKPAE
jgi:hypothetical protein